MATYTFTAYHLHSLLAAHHGIPIVSPLVLLGLQLHSPHLMRGRAGLLRSLRGVERGIYQEGHAQYYWGTWMPRRQPTVRRIAYSSSLRGFLYKYAHNEPVWTISAAVILLTLPVPFIRYAMRFDAWNAETAAYREEYAATQHERHDYF